MSLEWSSHKLPVLSIPDIDAVVTGARGNIGAAL